jgi:protocatechuate 3,4-dioxygenase, beta subunit
MNRRKLLCTGFLTSAALLALPRLAEAKNQCVQGKTPDQTEGPFYPIVDQVDKDADLVIVQGSTEIAEGNIVIVQGVLTDQHCLPVENALVEIWQACKTGRYNHPSDPNTAALDPNFQYWGKAITDKNGFYRFRTITPGSYPADTDWMRPPHIHFKVSRLGYIELITQMYFSGEALNDKDLILRRLKKSDQEKVIIPFQSQIGIPHPTGVFNIQIEKI